MCYRLCFLVGEIRKQLSQCRLVVDVAIADEPLDLGVDFIAIVNEFDFPALASYVDVNHDRVIPDLPERKTDFSFLKLFQQFQDFMEGVLWFHLLYSLDPSSFLIVLNPGWLRRARI